MCFYYSCINSRNYPSLTTCFSPNHWINPTKSPWAHYVALNTRIIDARVRILPQSKRISKCERIEHRNAHFPEARLRPLPNRRKSYFCAGDVRKASEFRQTTLRRAKFFRGSKMYPEIASTLSEHQPTRWWGNCATSSAITAEVSTWHRRLISESARPRGLLGLNAVCWG